MYKSLSDRLTSALDKLRGRGVLSEDDVNSTMREIRVALLEADVALPVVKDFIERAKAEAIGQELIKNVNPSRFVIKIVRERLIEALGSEPAPIDLSAPSPMGILTLGLQGSGKTTTSSKLAKFLTDKHKKNVLLASLDVYRPAAREQLAYLARSINVPCLEIVENQKPLEIAARAIEVAKKSNVDAVIFDTAGRLHIDDESMEELARVKRFVNPVESFLVADAMTGQDAVNVAKAFHEKIGVSGIILTRADGDARGGAALSTRYVTGKPIKFLGVGEKPEQLEVFDPHRIADRILGMGDIATLVERAVALESSTNQEKLAKKLEKGHFNLNDMAKQLEDTLKMGGFSGLLSFLPGIGKIKDKLDQAGIDDKTTRRQIGVIRSMTERERRDPKLMNGSRRKRVANGSGVSVMEVNRLLKRFEQARTMFKRVGKLGGKDLVRQGISAIKRGL